MTNPVPTITDEHELTVVKHQISMLGAQLLPLNEIYFDAEFNCREQVAVPNIIELANDIREKGLNDAILVREGADIPAPYKYVIVYGHRRFKAHQHIGRTHIPAKVARISDLDAIILNINENIQREDLNFLQQAVSIKKLADRGFSQSSIADMLKKNNKWVKDRLKLMEMPPQAQQLAAVGILRPTHIDALAKQPGLANKMQFLRGLRDKERQISTGEVLTKSIAHKEERVTKRTYEVRCLREVTEMQDLLIATFGYSFEVKILGWVIGAISTEEFYDMCQTTADDRHKFFARPTTPNNAIEEM